ncbi:MAG: EAL domain-containing protein [Lachnospiraceae bacterium]|nr:EAL domain-containing protein [Lachnospiraceae bacterium]
MDKIKKFFGFNKLSEYEKAFHREANVRSTLYMSAIIIILEIWMLVRFVKKHVLTGQFNTVELFFKYSKNYWILLFVGVIMLVYSLLYLNRKIKRSGRVSLFLNMIFTGICLYFGWMVSVSDYTKGRMVLCFLTMVLYVACLLIWKPYISMIMLTAIAWGFIYYLDQFVYDNDGNLIGVLEADKINYATFFISLITVVVSIYHQRQSEARKSAKLLSSAVTDELTGISNFKGFADEAEKRLSVAGKESLIYLFINIENFKLYNNHMGYAKGNELLIRIADGISQVFKGDVFARQSDDHFVILTADEGHKERIAKLQEIIARDTPDEMYLKLKVGSFKPDSKITDPRLEVDRARYACNAISNQADRNYAEYDQKMQDKFRLRNHIINTIDKAVSEGYIKVYYQPVVWSSDKKLCGCEALARWIDPTYGFLSPGTFIPVLEECRQIDKLDLCIYETVCRDLRKKLDEGEKIFPVSLNFSRLDFELMDVTARLEELVTKYDIPREYLHVEITESALTDDTYGLKRSMDVLHEKGYSLWLDDFGSGYSSLNVLKDFNFDVLKIDMVFLKNFGEEGYEENTENSKKIICTVIDLADNLGMRTLTEGVENEACAEFLTKVGCDRLQGYYYSKPVPLEDIYKMIDEGKFVISDEAE